MLVILDGAVMEDMLAIFSAKEVEVIDGIARTIATIFVNRVSRL